jgi:hypothetical protein
VGDGWVASHRPPGDEVSGALRRYNEAAATLVGLGITLHDLDPMDMLPDELMPLVWQEAYADAFADAVVQGRGSTAAD